MQSCRNVRIQKLKSNVIIFTMIVQFNGFASLYFDLDIKHSAILQMFYI